MWEIAEPGDTQNPAGLKRYPGRGIRLEQVAGMLKARDGIKGERAYAWQLTGLTDGSRQYFDESGSLLALEDRHGNRIDTFFRAEGAGFRLARVTHAYGHELEYSAGKVTVTGPTPGQDGKQMSASLILRDGQVRFVGYSSGSGPAGPPTPASRLRRAKYSGDGRFRAANLRAPRAP